MTWRKVQVFIINRNRLKAPKRLVDWLCSLGMEQVAIIDNASTYPPLLAWYEDLRRAGRVHVVSMTHNAGPYTLWEQGILDTLDSPYIVSDSDLVPADFCPDDVIERMLDLATRYPEAGKVGAGLRLDNLSPHYGQREVVQRWESQFWHRPLMKGVFAAAVDTTFALYPPRARYTNGPQNLRLGHPYLFEHTPWYVDERRLDAEEAYYREQASMVFANWSVNHKRNWMEESDIVQAYDRRPRILFLGGGPEYIHGWTHADREGTRLDAEVDPSADPLRPWPFPDGAFDGIYMNRFLSEVRDWPGLRRELARLAKPGAPLVCRTASDLEAAWSRWVAPGACDGWRVKGVHALGLRPSTPAPITSLAPPPAGLEELAIVLEAAPDPGSTPETAFALADIDWRHPLVSWPSGVSALPEGAPRAEEGPAPAAVLPPRRARVVVIRPAGNPHAQAFDEMAETLEAGLRALGVEADRAANQVLPGAFNVLLGWHLLEPAAAAALPAGTVLYNLEQMDERNRDLRQRLVQLGKRLRVWDYSPRNLEILKGAGLKEPAGLLPIGYAPCLTRIPQAPVEDIDVLFYGSTNPRRARILDQLQAAGVKVHWAFNVYGADRDALIARSKVVLNLHYYDSSIFELVRVSYLLANRKTVVAECHADTEVDPALREGLWLAPYEGLVQACLDALSEAEARRAVARRGFDRMAERAIAPLLRPLLPEAFGLSVRPPAVSVLVPTKDRPAYLERALGSLHRQTFRDFEVVVVNDGGRDVQAEVARARARGLDVTLLEHPASWGQAAARNTGTRAARGTWIAYLDDDDLYLPQHLQVLTDTLERTGAQVAYTDSENVTEQEEPGGWVELDRKLAMSHDFDRDRLLEENLTPVNNVMHARACWEAVGPHDESLPVLEDWEFWIRLSRRWTFVHVPQVTAEVRWRISMANTTFERRDQFPVCKARIADRVERMLQEEARRSGPAPKEGFLFEPAWSQAAWAEVLISYLSAFRPDEPVALILVWDPAGPGQPDHASAVQKVLGLAQRTGRTAIPEVVLVDRPGELPEVLRGFAALQWIPPDPATPLAGARGTRLAKVRGRIARHP